MRFEEKYSGNVFIGASTDLEAAQAIIYGMPMDWTVSFRPGSRFGPARIREASLVHEEYSHYLERELSEITFYDAGDIPLAFGNPERSLQQIADFVRKVLDLRKMPIGLGGEHLVTWPVVREVFKDYPDLAVIHIDAHADLRTDYEGEPLSHATPLRKIAELIGGPNLYQFGIRSMTKEEVLFAKEANIHFHPFDVVEPLKRCLPELKGRPVYVTIDIDAVDPAHAPGTGTPEPGGITSKEMLEAIHLIARSGVKVVGADLVEVAPAYDHSEQTPVLAAKLIREMLLGFVK
ncbi:MULTISPECIES: agmatinase [unclassified Thermoactinomyces]|jgi:agmatinase|uniref:agmatinase n=1 Tax=unclassified Thermoactinomyces TaxID=2634588 RepID=UPI0018DB31A9|nr:MULTISPECIES: agmatinase [unclassified Thermoactinomyces]MBH8597894.1 agmatinase [Thermoactinomyces sp. CICC 10523]MBH8604246.1 agmatinase [Thermoactinomyces sp. CICC 10522]MBH8607701.1 agmatinase [Thermoactinomyces sp. CICC 10521]